jgi:hypothetical protein
MSADIMYTDEDFMNSASLDPENISFPGKDRLRKSPEDLPESQVEYLSIAYLEKDLSPEQIKELELCLSVKSENRAIFEAVRKTKLSAPSLTYKNKNLLKKTPAGAKVFRIVSLTLSAAATIALLILAGIYIPKLNDKSENAGTSYMIQGTAVDTLFIPETQPLLADENVMPSAYVKVRTAITMALNESIPEENIAEPNPELIPAERESIFPAALPSAPGIEYRVPAGTLLASNNYFTVPAVYDDRNRVERFVAGIFRERVLRDSTYSDAPLKPFEIAIASIDGLNKLLDWNMELREISDGSGEVKSVSFSSALLSFNTPVRKTGE